MVAFKIENCISYKVLKIIKKIYVLQQNINMTNKNINMMKTILVFV